MAFSVGHTNPFVLEIVRRSYKRVLDGTYERVREYTTDFDIQPPSHLSPSFAAPSVAQYNSSALDPGPYPLFPKEIDPFLLRSPPNKTGKIGTPDSRARSTTTRGSRSLVSPPPPTTPTPANAVTSFLSPHRGFTALISPGGANVPEDISGDLDMSGSGPVSGGVFVPNSGPVPTSGNQKRRASDGDGDEDNIAAGSSHISSQKKRAISPADTLKTDAPTPSQIRAFMDRDVKLPRVLNAYLAEHLFSVEETEDILDVLRARGNNSLLTIKSLTPIMVSKFGKEIGPGAARWFMNEFDI